MSVTWHNNGRGPRILVRMADVDHVVSVARAIELRDALIRAIDEVAATESLQSAALKAEKAGAAMTRDDLLAPRPMSPLEIASLIERVRQQESSIASQQRRSASAASVVAGRAREAAGEQYHGARKSKKRGAR